MSTKNLNKDDVRLWVDVYKPHKLDDMVLSSEIKQYFKDMLKSKNLLNLTLGGPQGLGKSTLCNVLCEELQATKLVIPCAVEGNVSTAQTKLKDFCDSMPFDDKLKVVILDEVDAASATQDSSFQKALRNLIEQSQEDTRFLLNCNYIEKVIPPIKSRCPVINLKFDKKDLLKRIKFILDSEKIVYTKDDLKNFIIAAFSFYPDIRRIIGYLQGCCTSGKLKVSEAAITDNERVQFMKDIIDKTKTEKLLDVRQFYVRHKDCISDYKTFASEMYDYVIDNGIITNGNDILRMSDIIYQMNMVINPEVQFFALLTHISNCRS